MASCNLEALDRSNPLLVKEGSTTLLIFAKILKSMVLGVGQNKYNQDIGLRATVVQKKRANSIGPFFKSYWLEAIQRSILSSNNAKGTQPVSKTWLWNCPMLNWSPRASSAFLRSSLIFSCPIL